MLLGIISVGEFPKPGLRRIKSNGFVDKPHGLIGRKAEHTVLSGYTAVIDNLLSKSVTTASLIHERIRELGYSGGLTSIKKYIAQHKDLIPAKRQVVAPQGSRGMRYHSVPGESYQMDWGFVTVEDDKGNEYKVACFAMICHCCGQRSCIHWFTGCWKNPSGNGLWARMLYELL